VILIAEALYLGNKEAGQERLKNQLHELYGDQHPFSKSDTFPRFRFPVEGELAWFYGLDHTLTTLQIQRMNEALQIFTRPDFQPLQADLLNQNIAYLVRDDLGDKASGKTYIGTGIVLLDRRDLFGNKYLLASVIAHEGSHVLQGGLSQNATCADVLHREVADKTIPRGFLSWSAEQVLAGVKDGTIGAYHVTYWVLAKLNFNRLDFIREVIQTGSANGQSLVFCDEKK
jgi:hypothetical protein